VTLYPSYLRSRSSAARSHAGAGTNLEAVMGTGAIIAMSFGLVTIWTLMISAMVATWIMRDKD